MVLSSHGNIQRRIFYVCFKRNFPIMKIKHALFLTLVVVLAGCSPYVLAVRETYEVATDPRSLVTQATDTQAELQIKAALLASPVRGTSGIDVYCRQGVVVLVGVVPPGSQAGQAAVSIARQTSGVKRVETYFVPSRPSWESDIAIKEEIRATLIADPVLVSGRVDIAVYAGHVVLVGVVDSRANVQKFISDARSVSGVASVTSYIQTV
jgi:osmotically-inducible protein OsmY